MYPSCHIDKVRERGETRAVDPELRDALGRMAAGLRGEIRSGAAETRAHFAERIEASAAGTRAYIDERIGTSAAGTHRHFDVVGESLRGDIRSLAELMTLSNERMDGQIDEQATRSDGLEGRVLRLEARVSILEDDRMPRRPRRQR